MQAYLAFSLCLTPQCAFAQASGDADALAVLHSTLTALSPETSWEEIHAIQVQGAISVPSSTGTKTTPFSGEDVWSQRKIWSRHSIGAGSAKRDLIQNPSEGRALRLEDRSMVHTGRGSSLPPIEIPGANLATVLADQSCQVPRATVITRDEDNDHIQVNCGGRVDSESQQWTISRATHLPVKMSVLLDDMRNAGGRLNETVSFKHYQTYQDLIVPDECELSLGGMKRTITVQAVGFPKPDQFSQSDFEVSK